MKDLFIAFLETPNREPYTAIRAVVIADEQYDPYSDDLTTAGGLMKAGQYEEARAVLSCAMPNLLLSPLAHHMLAFIADQAGDQRVAELESQAAAACCQGILATGDGTIHSPYLVSRTSDEYDLVGFLEKSVAEQSLHAKGAKFLDQILLIDGTELWFDISQQHARLKVANFGA